MPTSSRTRTTVLILAALAIGLLGATLVRSGWLRSLVTGFFGPPRVELVETYAAAEASGTFDHSSFDLLLGDLVDANGFVDYSTLRARATELDDYIATIAEAPFDSLGRDEKLALLINAYNAFTLRLILDHYPIDSIRDIPGDQRWDAVRWSIAGEVRSLNQLEHDFIRPNFREPRVHFALVCAAVGCPPLRAEAYIGSRLDEQLEEQTRFAHADERWMRYRQGAAEVELTSLYDWYRGDFEQVSGSILGYAALYNDSLGRDLAAGREPQIRFLDYDWSLNQQ